MHGSAYVLKVYMPKDVAAAHGGKDVLKTGASLLVSGTLVETPSDVKQAVELKADKVLFFGPCDPKTYPMAKKKHGMEFLREKAHLRPRTNVIGAVARIRSQLAFATHQFFQKHGFLYVHTPIITASDCEGAGEMFQITTLLGEAEQRSAEATSSTTTQADAQKGAQSQVSAVNSKTLNSQLLTLLPGKSTWS
jgi:asparaginyl-tRNA synthetase